LEDAEVDAPRADRLAVLMGHNTGDLVEMREVMDGPSGEELREGDRTEGRMMAASSQVLGVEMQRAKGRQIRGAQIGKFIEQLRKPFGLALAGVAFAVEGREGSRFAEFQNHFCARHPIGSLGVNEMRDYFERGPGRRALVLGSPKIGEIAEKGAERSGSASEKRDGVVESWIHFGLLSDKKFAKFNCNHNGMQGCWRRSWREESTPVEKVGADASQGNG
jgi:hypothetical protein